jgi:GMP reductase
MKALNYNDIVLTPRKSIVSSRSKCDTSAELGSFKFDAPVVAANMKSIITPEICKLFDENNWFYVYHRIDGPQDVFDFAYRFCEINNFRVRSISIGIKKEWITLLRDLSDYGVPIDYITVDIAHSHTEEIYPILNNIKHFYPNAYVICGNGCTAEWAEFLEETGMVDCIKVGIGVSQSCRTRQYTGFGSTSLTSLRNCNDGCGLDVMSDGGITVEGDTIHYGDIAKAIAFGADWVMSGAVFSRCIDSPAIRNGYYGNASREAKGNNHVEGELVKVSTSGLTILETMKLIKESLQSSISYAGVDRVDKLYGADYEIINK